MTSAIPVQCSRNWGIKPFESWSLRVYYELIMCISWPDSSARRAMQKSRGGGQHVYLRFEVKGREGGRILKIRNLRNVIRHGRKSSESVQKFSYRWFPVWLLIKNLWQTHFIILHITGRRLCGRRCCYDSFCVSCTGRMQLWRSGMWTLISTV